MAIYYQHIGREMWARDAPRTLGSDDGVRRFSIEDIRPYLTDISPVSVEAIASLGADIAPTGFQIWGLPSGAQRVLTHMTAGDYLILLEAEEFRYAGQVIQRLHEPSRELSNFLWGEQRFPLIVILQGQLIRYSWDAFKTEFDFDSRYHMRGNTMRLAPDRFEESSWTSEEEFIAHLFRTDENHQDTIRDEFELFTKHAQAHLRLVRDRAGQATFRDNVLREQEARCAVCGFDIPEGLEAAHLVPKKASGSDDSRNGLSLCVLHYRLFDRGLFSIDPQSLKIIPTVPWTLEDLRITSSDINPLRARVHEEALRWNAEQRS